MPAAQAEQFAASVAPSDGDAVPGGHAMQPDDVAPSVGPKDPTGQGAHAASDAAPAAFVNDPTGHDAHASEPLDAA